MKRLIQANLRYLQQAVDLVNALEDGSYACEEPAIYNSTVGGHLRHCLEHYESFTVGVADSRVDYDARKRDRQVENKTGAARDRINAIRQALENLSDGDPFTHVLVKVDCGGANDQGNDHSSDRSEDGEWQRSTVGRELQFLVSHTVHHFAMIRSICQLAGKELDPDFGMAPSTLRYRKQTVLAATPDGESSRGGSHDQAKRT